MAFGDPFKSFPKISLPRRMVGSYGSQPGYGGTQDGQEKSFTTGYSGSNPDFQGSFAKLGMGAPSMTPEDKAAIQWAFDQASKSFGQGQDRLAPGQFAGSTLGQGAQSRYLNPTGMDPAVLERVKSELAAMFSGARKDQLANFQNRANASGFGDSAGALQGAQQIEAQNAQDLVSAITNVLMQNEGFKQNQSQTAAGLAAQLMQLEAAMNQQSAQGYFGREFPAIPGMGGDAGYKYLNSQGQIMPQPQWTLADWEAAMAERQRFVNSGGMAA